MAQKAPSRGFKMTSEETPTSVQKGRSEISAVTTVEEVSNPPNGGESAKIVIHGSFTPLAKYLVA
jgi:hypothetical protein